MDVFSFFFSAYEEKYLLIFQWLHLFIYLFIFAAEDVAPSSVSRWKNQNRFGGKYCIRFLSWRSKALKSLLPKSHWILPRGANLKVHLSPNPQSVYSDSYWIHFNNNFLKTLSLKWIAPRQIFPIWSSYSSLMSGPSGVTFTGNGDTQCNFSKHGQPDST